MKNRSQGERGTSSKKREGREGESKGEGEEERQGERKPQHFVQIRVVY